MPEEDVQTPWLKRKMIYIVFNDIKYQKPLRKKSLELPKEQSLNAKRASLSNIC